VSGTLPLLGECKTLEVLWHFNDGWAIIGSTKVSIALTSFWRASTELVKSSGKADKRKERSHGTSEAQVTDHKDKPIFLRVDRFVYTLGEVALEMIGKTRQVRNESVKGAVGLLLCYRLLQAMEGAPTLMRHAPRASRCVQEHLTEVMR
jgi:hypothetical protein